MLVTLGDFLPESSTLSSRRSSNSASPRNASPARSMYNEVVETLACPARACSARVENDELVASPGIGQFVARAKFGQELKAEPP